MNSLETTASVAQEFQRDVLKVNFGLHVLRARLSHFTPSDFEWAFLFASDGVVGSWNWKADSVYQQELRCDSLHELLERWSRIDWQMERARARMEAIR